MIVGVISTEDARAAVRAVHLSGGLTPEEFHILDDAISRVEMSELAVVRPRALSWTLKPRALTR